MVIQSGHAYSLSHHPCQHSRNEWYVSTGVKDGMCPPSCHGTPCNDSRHSCHHAMPLSCQTCWRLLHIHPHLHNFVCPLASFIGVQEPFDEGWVVIFVPLHESPTVGLEVVRVEPFDISDTAELCDRETASSYCTGRLHNYSTCLFRCASSLVFWQWCNWSTPATACALPCAVT